MAAFHKKESGELTNAIDGSKYSIVSEYFVTDNLINDEERQPIGLRF
jgi:hypothetical protein